MSRASKRRFTPQHTLIELVEEDFNILPILSRFSIPLGVGSRTIREVCDDAGINTDIFLMIVNYILADVVPEDKPTLEAVNCIVDFLHNSHDYFLGYKFPHIRENLIKSLDPAHSDINPAIITFFDDYVKQVEKHFEYEENRVWPYIRTLGKAVSSGYHINIFREHHDEIGEKLNELKSIILRYYTTSMPDKMYDALVDIYNCEEDLEKHHDIENHILIPMVAELELRQESGGGL